MNYYIDYITWLYESGELGGQLLEVLISVISFICGGAFLSRHDKHITAKDFHRD
jgi:hypothetical protein